MYLIVAGRRDNGSPYGDVDQDTLEARFIKRRGYRLRRCDAPQDLVPIVEAVAAKHGRIDILDLYDHGNAGYIMMGEGTLFGTDENPHSELQGRDIAGRLSHLLAPTAHVRLLGCKTAASERAPFKSRLLLIKLARALGEYRIAFGTIRTVTDADFTNHGLYRDQEDNILYSSTAALDGPAPSRSDRRRHLARVSPLLSKPQP